MESTVQRLSAELGRTRDHSTSHQHELASLQGQLEATHRDVQQLQEENEALLQQKGHLKEDLNTMTQV